MTRSARASVGSVEDTREAVTIAVWGLSGSIVYVVICQALGWIDVPVVPVVGLIALLAIVNALLARTSSDWARNAWAAWTYEGLHAIAHTVLLYLCGGPSMSLFLILYGFLIVHTEVLRPDASVFVTANVCALCYGTLAVLEYQGWLTSPRGPFFAMSGERYVLFASFAFLAFNFLALYANRHGRQLRRLADRLHDRTADLEAANDRLARVATALEAKQDEVRQFVYAVTHDLKGPLGGVGLRADLVLEAARDRLTASEREHLHRILGATDRAHGMIQDLLEMFRVTSVEEPFGWVDLAEVARASVDSLRAQLDAKRARIDVGAMPRVWGQRRKLEHLLGNLIGNAVKYVPAGNGRIAVRAARDDGAVVLRVSDNGCGIAEAYHRHILEPFGRAPASEQVVDGATVAGSGIGLAVVRQIAEAHGGSIRVDSAAGAGATFSVRLAATPLHVAAPEPVHA